jgi:TM2 domain-containing membrane protein YozV/DNA-directed RNA polymerase subunit RPC12/RpoP
MIVFRCAKCAEQLEAPSSLAGAALECPTCRNVSLVPSREIPIASYAGPQPACSRAVYILLGLFLGAFGVHNFAAGRTGPAVAQLLVTIFLFWLIVPVIVIWIWVIIELCSVTRDGRGVRMT